MSDTTREFIDYIIWFACGMAAGVMIGVVL